MNFILRWRVFPLVAVAFLALYLISSNVQAVVTVHEGFSANSTNNLTINGYDGTSTSTGITGSWSWTSDNENEQRLKYQAIVWEGISNGYSPDESNGNQTWWEKNNAWGNSLAEASLTNPLDMTSDGVFYMSFFSKSSINDYTAQVGFNDGTNELMWGNGFFGTDASDPKGVTAYYEPINSASKTNANHTYVTHGGTGGETFFWVARMTKSNSGTTDDLDVDIMGYNLTTLNEIDDEDPSSWLRSVSLDGVSTTFNNLQLKLNGANSNWPALDEVRLGETWDDVTGAVPIPITELSLEVHTDTGLVFIKNYSDLDIEFDYLEIGSADSSDGSLIPANHNSLQSMNLQGYASGTGIGDGWEVGGGSNESLMGEAYLLGSSVFTADGAPIGLGAIFDTTDDQDLTFKYGLEGTFVQAEVEYVSGASGIAADYDDDGDVDEQDFSIWQASYGSGNILANDSSAGAVDGADFVEWQRQLGATSLGQAVTTVPEPCSALLFVTGLFAISISRRRKRLAAHATEPTERFAKYRKRNETMMPPVFGNVMKAMLFILAVFTCQGQKLAHAQPNVVLFLVDDMGWVDWQQDATFNPQGSTIYETPNMLRLANSGVSFSNAYASSPVCSPTRAAIMTGKNPARTRITEWIAGSNHMSTNLREPDWVKNLPDEEITLAESLKSAGYNTGFFGKWHLGESGNPSENPLNHGFDLNIGGARAGSPPGGYFAGADGGWGAPGLESGYDPDDYLSDVLTDEAVDYVEQNANGSNPFFVMLSHYAVHTPLDAPADLESYYQNKINNSSDPQGHNNDTYAAMIHKMDESLGRVLDQLEDPNGDGNTSDSIRDDTLIIFASDNGGLDGPTDNRPLRDAKGSIHEGGIREPFIVSWTGNTAMPDDSGTEGRVDTARTISHDIPTTILDAAGLLDDGVTAQTSAAERDGVSILPALEGQAFDRGYQFWHYPHKHNEVNAGNVGGGPFVSAVRKDQWKLIYYYDDQSYELYDLVNDIGETTDLFGVDPSVDLDLSSALRLFLQETDAQMPIDRSTGLPVSLPLSLIDVTLGDFDDSGSIGVSDWLILRSNLFSDVSDLLDEQRFALGDNNVDGIIDGVDFADFKALYEQANGVGSFDSIISVPEPGTLVLLVCASLLTRRRSFLRRTAY